MLIFDFPFCHRATAAGFSKLSERISHLEDALLMQHHLQGGDQELPPEEEELDEYERRLVYSVLCGCMLLLLLVSVHCVIFFV